MRNLGLDILRFIAVLLVICHHLNSTYLDGMPTWSAEVFGFLRHGGGIGVYLFFVLSGFLISGLLFDEFHHTRTIDVRRFLIRRGFKLYPPLWALIGLTACVTLVRDPNRLPTIRPRLLSELLFVQNYFPGMFGHTWTLAVEEHFYILFATVAGLLCSTPCHTPFSSIPTLWASVLITCTALRMYTVASLATPVWQDFHLTHLCADALMFGVFLSYLCRFLNLDARLRNFSSVTLATAGVLAASQGFHECQPTIASAGLLPVVIYTGCGLLILAARRLESGTNWLLRLAGFLGTTGYSTYLWHGWVSILAARGITYVFGSNNAGGYLLLAVVGAFVVGIVMHRLIETPAMALRNLLYPSYTAGRHDAHACPPR